MTDFRSLVTVDQGQDAQSITIIDARGHSDWLNGQSERARSAATAQGFRGEAGTHAILPGDAASDWSVVAAVKDAAALSSWCLAKIATALPAGRYRLSAVQPGRAALGWMLAQHRFTRYKAPKIPHEPRVLLSPEPAQMDALIAEAAATALVRDMVDTPAADMGPADIEATARAIAKAHKAVVDVVQGDALEQGYPMIHAVGRAAPRNRAPRLIRIDWGDPAAPRIAIVGKGVTFDSGGLDIKPAAGMQLMKKDMGGAAHALALMQMVMELRLPVRLLTLIPVAENSISGDAMRPGDILTSRAGLTVEVDNTDAEGRLILADALALVAEEHASAAIDYIIDFATLTGAARVALGPDLPALYANDDALADALIAASRATDDPLWRMPLWDGYDEMIASDIADLTNSPAGAFAGSVTAALFLRRFVPRGVPWAHFDTFAWRPAAKPGRPKGGAALGLGATWAMLKARYSK